MKNRFPEYKAYKHKPSDMQKIEEKLSLKDKTILKDFLKYCSATAGESKVKKIKRIFIQLYDITELPFSKQNKTSYIHFLALLNSSDYSIPTKNEVKVYIKRFVKWLHKDLNLLEELNPLLKKEKYDFNPQRVNENTLITEPEVIKMIKQADTSRDKALIYTLFESGSRPQELLNLKWKDIVFQEGYADLKLYSGKTKATRIFPVKNALPYIIEWKEKSESEPNDYIFPSTIKDKPMTSDNVNKILRKLAKASGIHKNIFAYLFRHSRATRLYEELPTPITEQLMGHTDMFHTYSHISNQKARQELLDKIYKQGKLTSEDKKRLEELESRYSNIEKELDLLKRMYKAGRK